MRIGIVEDDAVSRKLLLDYLHRYETEHGDHFTIEVFTDGAELVGTYRPRFDILLLDIQMAHVDGLTAARHVRGVDDQVVIVFITSAPQFAIKGYEVDALSYLLKPLPWFAFEQELTRSIQAARKRRSSSLVLAGAGEAVRIDIADILWIESLKHRITIHALGLTHALTGTLKDMEERLDGHDFFRSNSCYLVNLAHVSGVRDQDCVMSDGTALRISRPRRKAFLQALTEYAGGVGTGARP